MTSPVVRSFLARSEKSPLGLFGLDTPSGGDRASLKRDLADGKRILLRRPTVYEIRSIDKKAREVEVVASTSGVKRDGNAIFHSEKAWDFRNFEKNPAMLWSHDYGSAFAPPGLPLGYWKTWGIDKTKAGNALVMRGWFEEDEFPEKVWRRILSGTIRAVSIGWNPLEFEELEDDKGQQVGWNFTLNELYECSWVVIGADPDAGIRGMYADLNDAELDVIANGRRAHELSRGVAYMLDHRDAPDEFVRAIVNLPKESDMETHTVTTTEVPESHSAPSVTPVEVTTSDTIDIAAPFRAVSDAIATRDALEAMDSASDIDAELRELGIADDSIPKARAIIVRVGKKMASKRLQKLKSCHDSLGEVIDECKVEEGCDPEDPTDPETASAPDPEVTSDVTPDVDPSEALRDLSEALVRTVEQDKQSRYVAAILGDLVSDLTSIVKE